MGAFRRHLSRIALLLLTLAALDLTVAGVCDDMSSVGSLDEAQWCTSDDATEGGHQGDDCFCCSRSVRVEPGPVALAIEGVAEIVDPPASRLLHFALPPPYHPPLI
jgi:hypothetical protein